MSKRVRSDLLTIAEKEKAKREAELVIAEKEKVKREKELVIANAEKAERADELIIANKEKAEREAELVIAEEEKAKRAAELVIANKEKAKRAAELVIANEEKEKLAAELVIANAEKAKRAAELVIANAEKAKRAAVLVIANLEKEKRADELIIADKELAYQNEEKAKRAAELVIADVNKTKREAELVIAKIEKAKRIAKSIIADKELSFQTEEKSKRAAELVIADAEKAKREAELVIANIKKAKRSAELIIANVEKAKRSAELVIANKELVYQKSEKSKRAAELIIANVEKAKRAAELVIANIEKSKRAAELVFTNKELALAEEKGKLVVELTLVNKELTIQITERKQFEKALFESEERFRLLFNQAPLGYQALDIDGNFIDVNQQWIDTLGYTREEVIGKWFGDFLSPVYLDGFRKRFPIFKAQGHIHSEFEMVHKNGNILFIAFDGKIGYDLKGELKQTHCILQDITEVKKAQEETIRQKELLQQVIDNLPVMITYFDNNGKILLTNNELVKVLGWTHNEWETKNIFKKCYPDPKYMKEVLDFMNSGESGWKDSRTNTKYGTVIDTSWTNIKLPNGLSMGIGQDITERKNNESKLIENEEFTRRIIDSSNDCIKVLDLEGNLLSMSAGGQKLLEIDDITVYLKKSWIDFWKGKDREGAVEAVSKAKKGDIGFFTGYSPTEKSNPKWWEIIVSPMKDSTGNIFNLLAVSRDITDRIKSEEKLQHAYVFNETLLKTIPFGMDIVDETGTVLFHSEEFKKIFGESAIGKKCWDLFRDDKKQCSDCPLFKGIIIGETEIYESHGVLGNRIFDISHTGMMYQGKKAMLEIFQDITKRKIAENKLIRSEHELKKAQEITHIGSWYLDIVTNEVMWTEELYKMYGFNPALPPPQYTEHMKLFTPESWELLSSSLEKTRVTGVPYELELQTVRKNGSNGWMWVRGEVETDSEGNTVGLWGAAQDISEHKEKEKQLEKALEMAEESNRLKSAFLANMSHEIRTPMNGILGFTELLKEPNLSTDDQQDFIQTIQISGARMLNTINNIVDVSKIEAGLANLVIDETNINKKIEFAYKFFKPEVERKGLQFIFKNGLPTKDAVIKTDNEKVYGVLTNLVKNAIKFTYDGSIEFGYEKKGAYLEFYVKDTGVGIPKNLQQTIFERFRQGSNDLTRLYEGNGLGLSIAKSYVEMLGGEIWVESEEGRGSTFYFTIPYHSAEDAKAEIQGVDSSEIKEVQMKNLKILIVEDDEVSYSLLKRTIQKIGKEVLHAITGIQAIEACRINPDLDLILMDIRMPIMDGCEATRQIRQFNKDVIIIAQTAYAFAGDSEIAIEAGCNDYITKPINMTLLFELIKKHVNK